MTAAHSPRADTHQRLIAFTVKVSRPAHPARLQFEAMAADAFDVVMTHECLRQAGERIYVSPKEQA